MNLDESVGVYDCSDVGPPLSAKNDAAEKFFSNTVIWKIIGSYLNVGDLKACRLVSSGLHGIVMKETDFLHRCVVSLKPDQITRNIFGSTSELWKNVLLKFQSPGNGSYCNFSEEDLENLDWLYPVIANVESLSLRMKKGTKGGNFFPVLKQLLKAPKKLRSLAMEPIFLICGTAGNFEDLKEVLGNIEEFEILQPSPECLRDIEGWADIEPWLVSTDFIKNLENLRVAKSYYLQKLVFVYPLPVSSPATFLEGEILTSVLTRIAHQSSKTLKYVTLGESRLLRHKWSCPSLPFVPNSMSKPGVVANFFEAMPMLQELDYSVVHLTIPMEILNVIEERSDRMLKVKLENFNFLGINWEFLEKTKLEEFHLGLIDNCYRSGRLPSEALNHLPSTIRRLYLRGTLESNPVSALTRLNPTLITQLTLHR